MAQWREEVMPLRPVVMYSPRELLHYCLKEVFSHHMTDRVSVSLVIISFSKNLFFSFNVNIICKYNIFFIAYMFLVTFSFIAQITYASEILIFDY